MARISNDSKPTAPVRSGGPQGPAELEGPPAPTLDEAALPQAQDKAATFGGGNRGSTALPEGLEGPVRLPEILSVSELENIETNSSAAYGFALAHAAKVMGDKVSESAVPQDVQLDVTELLVAAETAFALNGVEEGNTLLIQAVELADENGLPLHLDLVAASHVGTKEEMSTFLSELENVSEGVLERLESVFDRTTRRPGALGAQLVAAGISKAGDLESLPKDGLVEMALGAEVTVEGANFAVENKITIQATEIGGERKFVVAQDLKAGVGVKGKLSKALEGKAMASLLGKREWVADSPEEAVEIAATLGTSLAKMQALGTGNVTAAAFLHVFYPRTPDADAVEIGGEAMASLSAELGTKFGVDISDKAEVKGRVERNHEGLATKAVFSISRESSVAANLKLIPDGKMKASATAETIGKRSAVVTFNFDPPVEESAIIDHLSSTPVSIDAVYEFQVGGPGASLDPAANNIIRHSESKRTIQANDLKAALMKDNFDFGEQKVTIAKQASVGVTLDATAGITGAELSFVLKRVTPQTGDNAN